MALACGAAQEHLLGLLLDFVVEAVHLVVDATLAGFLLPPEVALLAGGEVDETLKLFNERCPLSFISSCFYVQVVDIQPPRLGPSGLWALVLVVVLHSGPLSGECGLAGSPPGRCHGGARSGWSAGPCPPLLSSTRRPQPEGEAGLVDEPIPQGDGQVLGVALLAELGGTSGPHHPQVRPAPVRANGWLWSWLKAPTSSWSSSRAASKAPRLTRSMKPPMS